MFQCSYEACHFRIRNRQIMEIHIQTEHGPNCTFTEITDKKMSDSVNPDNKVKKKRGQTVCGNCQAYFNNRSVPEICICGHNLDKKVEKPHLNPVKLTANLFSVRKHKSGYNKRVIVDIDSKYCYNLGCVENRSHFPLNTTFRCEHLDTCSDPDSIPTANVIELEASSLEPFVNSDVNKEELYREVNKDDKVVLFLVSNSVLVLPVFQVKSHECMSGLLHIDLVRMKCPIRKCSTRPRYHFHVTCELMCIHILVSKLVRNEYNVQTATLSEIFSSTPQFSKPKTIENIIENIVLNIPSPLEEEKEQKFLQDSLIIQHEVFLSGNLTTYDVKTCDKCLTQNILRKKRLGKGSLLVTPGFMTETYINTYLCKFCDKIYYPDMYKVGFVPICENLIVSWSYLVEARNNIGNGNKLYKSFASSLRRLCIENKKLAARVNVIDFHNLAVKLTKLAVSYNSASLLRSFEDGSTDCLAQVLCLHCGIVPVTLMSDGNAKNSIIFRGKCDNLIIDKSDVSEIPSLKAFLKKCIISATGSSIFQNYPKEKINLLKIPPIISAKLCGELKNRENLKKSAFTQEFDLSNVDFPRLVKLVKTNEFDLLKSRTLTLKQLRQIAKKIKIPKYNKQSKIMLENVLLELVDWMIGGNSNCHKYTHSLGESGGWSDSWCIHSVKYAAKMMILQESVVDPSDIYLSLLFPPILQVLDDPCTMVNHLFCSEEKFAETFFGANRGCFEAPHETDAPNSEHDCPQLLPLSLNPRQVCEESLNNPTSNVHPISKTIPRFVLGTKMSESHKTQNQCLYHNVNNCIQSPQIKELSNI